MYPFMCVLSAMWRKRNGEWLSVKCAVRFIFCETAKTVSCYDVKEVQHSQTKL